MKINPYVHFAGTCEEAFAYYGKVLGAKDMKDKMYAAGFLAVPKGAGPAWARVKKEIDLFKGIIDQAGIQKL